MPTVRFPLHRVAAVLLTIGLTCTALVAATLMPAASATRSGSTGARESNARLRSEARNGSLASSHGEIRLCAGKMPSCQAMIVTRSSSSSEPLITNQPVGYGADDLRAIYHLPATTGNVGTIAVIETGAYPNLESDLAHYRAQFGLPACTKANGCLSIVDYRGGPPQPPTTSSDDDFLQYLADGETALDVDMVSAACPACHILEVQAPLPDIFPQSQAESDQAAADFGTAVQTAVGKKAAAVSLSYSFSADTTTDSGETAHDLYQPGTAVVASAGDSGYNGNTKFKGEASSGWPENLPWVTAVGGTEVYADESSAGTTYRHTAWNFGGSGCSYDLPPALGQPDTIAAHCDGHRAASDISAVADDVAVYFTYDGDGGWGVFAGTSASAPFVGGLYARAGHLSKVIGPNTLYSAAKGTFTDVTLGQNVFPNECTGAREYALCHAGRGWDGPTGVGTPNGLRGL